MLEVNTIVNDSKLFMQNFVNFILLKAKALSISPQETVSLISSLIALSIASFNNLHYLIFGQFAYSFSALPVGLWFILICINYCFQVYFLMLNGKHSRIQCFIYPLLLSPFSTYWYVCIIKAFFVKGWASTKTTHVFQLSVPVIEQTGRSRGGSTKRPGDTN
jgi:hypothetical protein